MKPIRLFAAFFFAWMTLTAAVAAADITVTKRDVNMAAGLDKNVANILVLLQDGETTDTMMVASINSRTGRSVMMRVDCRLMVDVPEVGETRLADVYALGAQKCRGMLAERTINTLLGLNIGTYVALDVTNLPQLVDAIDTVSMELDEREEKIGYKIRAAQQVDRVPYMLVLGAKEAEAGNVSVRDRKGETTTMEVDEFIAKVTAEIKNRSL